MLLSLFWKGILAGLSVSVLIGPIGILIIQKTVNRGWLSGFVSGIGASLSDLIYSAVAALSLSFIISFVDEHRFIFDIIATIILVVLGVHIFRKNPIEDLRNYKTNRTSYLSDFFSTFAITIPNPLVVFVLLAVFAKFEVQIEPGDYEAMAFLLMGVAIGANSWWFALTNVVSLFRNKFNLRVLWWFNKIAGVTVIAVAVIGFIISLVGELNI